MTKVLIVDDEPFVIRMLRDKLRNAGISVVSAVNGKEAVGLAMSERPDLIIMDWMMPEMNGIDACKAIRTNPEHAGTPIIMLTAKGQELDEKKGGTRAPHTTSPSLSAPAGSCASWKNALSRPAAGVLSGCGKNVAARTVAFFHASGINRQALPEGSQYRSMSLNHESGLAQRLHAVERELSVTVQELADTYEELSAIHHFSETLGAEIHTEVLSAKRSSTKCAHPRRGQREHYAHRARNRGTGHDRLQRERLRRRHRETLPAQAGPGASPRHVIETRKPLIVCDVMSHPEHVALPHTRPRSWPRRSR